jgi:hypothetical protein
MSRTADEITEGERKQDAVGEYAGLTELFIMSFQSLGFVCKGHLETGGYNYVRRLGPDADDIQEALELNFKRGALAARFEAARLADEHGYEDD